MIWHPALQFIWAGIGGALVVTSANYMDSVLNSLGSGSRFDCKFTYRVEGEAGGIAHALTLAQDFTAVDKLVVDLGDNFLNRAITRMLVTFDNNPVALKCFSRS